MELNELIFFLSFHWYISYIIIKLEGSFNYELPVSQANLLQEILIRRYVYM